MRSHAAHATMLVAASPGATLIHRYACRSTGPGQRPEYVWESACFACEVLAVYTAFLALPYSNNRSEPELAPLLVTTRQVTLPKSSSVPSEFRV